MLRDTLPASSWNSSAPARIDLRTPAEKTPSLIVSARTFSTAGWTPRPAVKPSQPCRRSCRHDAPPPTTLVGISRIGSSWGTLNCRPRDSISRRLSARALWITVRSCSSAALPKAPAAGSGTCAVRRTLDPVAPPDQPRPSAVRWHPVGVDWDRAVPYIQHNREPPVSKQKQTSRELFFTDSSGDTVCVSLLRSDRYR
jgi:hypothetical protein